MPFLGIKGPKQLLASSIAVALSDYFEVNEKLIESNLLRDSKIVLRNVNLRPQTTFLNHGTTSFVMVYVTGSVEEVSLKWTWVLGHNEDNMWMKDVTLAIRGLEFKMQLSIAGSDTQSCDKKNPFMPSSFKSEVKNNPNDKSNREGRLEAYVRNQVEQIIDALTLIVADFKFTLILPTDAGNDVKKDKSMGFSVGGKQLELRSLGRQKEIDKDQKEQRALVQLLTIGSFYVDVINSKKNNSRTIPLLKPISYEAIATKKGGKRFDSIGTGLTFEGRVLSENKGQKSNLQDVSDIVFHLGASQLETLSYLGSFILVHNANETVTQTQTHKQLVKQDDEEIRENGVKDDQLESLKQLALNSSVFNFPIASVALILPNDVKITMQSFSLHYHTDGTVMNIKSKCGSGIMIDDYPLISTRCDDGSAIKTYWMIDLISNRFSIETAGDNCKVNVEGSTIKLCPEIFEKVLEGIKMISETPSSISMDCFKEKEDTFQDKPHPTESKIWLMDIQQSIGIVLEQESDSKKFDMVKIIVKSLSTQLPFDSSSKLSCGGLTVGSCSWGNLVVTIPQVFKLPNSDIISFDSGISFVAESSNTLEALMGLVKSFTVLSSNIPKSTEMEPMTVKYDSPLIKIPCVDINLHKESLSLKMIDIKATGSSLKCMKLIVKNTLGAEMSLKEASISLHQYPEVHINSLECLHLPKTLSLLEPIRNLKILYKDELVYIQGTKVSVLLLNAQEEADTAVCDETKSQTPIKVPFAMNLLIERIILKRDTKKLKERKTEMSMKMLHLTVQPNDSVHLPLEISFDEAKSDIVELYKTKSSALVNVANMNEIKNLDIRVTKPIRIYAGLSISDWPGMFVKLFQGKKTKSAKSLEFPDAYIAPLEIQVSYKFSKLSKIDTLIHASAFKGDSSTKSDDFVTFYKKKVINQVPDLFHGTEVLGVNVVDTTLLVGGYSLGLAGAVVGICGVDAIKNNLKAGRESRGAEASDKYQIGDFVRGINCSISQATKTGVKIRDGEKESTSSEGKKERKGNIIDYATGASSDVAQYVDKNQAKLAGAGAATAAMAVGTVLLGPVGTVAGAVVAGTLSEKVVKRNKPKMNSSHGGKDDETMQLTSITRSSPEPFDNSVLQGILFKRRRLLKTQWKARWFVLDVENRVLNCHLITKNAPQVVDTNMFNLFAKPASKAMNDEELIDFQLKPEESLALSTSKIQIEEKITSVKHNLFALKIENEKDCWYLATTSNESRIIWLAMLMDLSGLNTYDDILRCSK